MRTFNIVVERDPDTGLYVGYVPGWPGAHSQGETLDELRSNLQEVVEMLLEDGEPKLESEFVCVQTIKVGVSAGLDPWSENLAWPDWSWEDRTHVEGHVDEAPRTAGSGAGRHRYGPLGQPHPGRAGSRVPSHARATC